MKFLVFLIFLSQKLLAVVGLDERIDLEKLPFKSLFNHVVEVRIANRPKCTGVAISEDIVLTAAHCFEKEFIKQKKASSHLKVLYVEETSEMTKIRHIKVKDIFAGVFFEDCKDGALFKDFTSRDFAFLKLEKKVFKKDQILLEKSYLKEDYENISPQGPFGTYSILVGFNKKGKKKIHLNCSIRQVNYYKERSILYTDCDASNGFSGSPLFSVLRHKKTKKIKLLLHSIINNIYFEANNLQKRGYYSYQTHPLCPHQSWTGGIHLATNAFFQKNLKALKADENFFENSYMKNSLKTYPHLKEGHLDFLAQTTQLEKVSSLGFDFLMNHQLSCSVHLFTWIEEYLKEKKLEKTKAERSLHLFYNRYFAKLLEQKPTCPTGLKKIDHLNKRDEAKRVLEAYFSILN